MARDEICERLQRMVLDENKIVTYKILSRTFGIYPNKAKQYLSEFFETNRIKENLGAYYFLSGTEIHENNIQRLKAAIVEEKDLENVKSAMTAITSCHIYCIHKGTLADKCALYTTDYGLFDDNKQLTIVNPHISTQPKKKLIHNGRNDAMKPVIVNQAQEKKEEVKVKSPTKNKGKSVNKDKSPNIFNMFQKKKEPSMTDVVIASLPSNNNSVSGESLRNSSTSQNITVSEPKKKELTNKKSKTPAAKTDMKSLFAKQAEKNASMPTVKQEILSDDDFEEKSSKSSPSKAQHSPKKTPAKPQLKRNKKKLKVSSEESDSERSIKPKKKKHRRIATLDDSDSASENEEEKDKARRDFFGNNFAATPSPMNISGDDDDDIIPPTPVEKGKKKVLKLVSKTFKGEDGYFVTKKVKEYVTESEGSDAEESKKSKPVSSKNIPTSKKKSPIVNTKQSSLTSFFKQR